MTHAAATVPLTLPTAGPIGAAGLVVRVVDAASAPGLRVRPAVEPWDGEALAGHELWHAVTDTVVIAGLRESGSAARLIRLLPGGMLNRILMRMTTPPAKAAADAGTSGATFGTLCALSSLACWPSNGRRELVERVGEAAEAALRQFAVNGRGGSATALHWVSALTRLYGDDPMVLAPLLLQVRAIPAGRPYVVPPGWAWAHLFGQSVHVVAAGATTVGGGLGAADADSEGFVAALTAAHQRVPVDPDAGALAQAAQLARRRARQLGPAVTLTT